MAKFIYRMQNILDIKYKLEEQAKQEFLQVRIRLNEEMDKLKELEYRKDSYMNAYRQLLLEKLDVLEIESCKNAIYVMDGYIDDQTQLIQTIEIELERASQKMNEAMKERKIHEKLKEKRFEEFLASLNQEEMKEIDQLISFTYNQSEE